MWAGMLVLFEGNRACGPGCWSSLRVTGHVGRMLVLFEGNRACGPDAGPL